MGINYGIRGGDLLDINQANNNIYNLEQSLNYDFFLNTIHFNKDATTNNLNFIGKFNKNYLCVAVVYVLLRSGTTPTTYPSLPVVLDVESNASVTLTKQEDNSQVFNFDKNGIEYKAVVLRTRYSLSVSDKYIKVSFNGVNGAKDLNKTHFANQFLCWQEKTSKTDLPRIVDGALSAYADFNSFDIIDSSFSNCLLNDDNECLIIDVPRLTTEYDSYEIMSDFFYLIQFSKEYLKNMRFIFKKISTGTNKFISNGQEVYLQVENTYNDFIEYSISDVDNFYLTINNYFVLQNPILKMQNINAGVSTYYECLSVKCKNKNWEYPALTSADSLNTATLFCLQENAQTAHNYSNFKSELGILVFNPITLQRFFEYSQIQYPFFVIFKNNYFQVNNEFKFDYVLANNYFLKFSISNEFWTIG